MKIKLSYAVVIYLFGTVVTQSCLLPGDPNSLTSFSNQGRGSGRLPSGSQVIITSYQFQCCGRVTRWRTYVEPGGNKHKDGVYSVTFQVWRPGPAVESDGCYSLVGEDRYENIYLEEHGLVQRDVDSSTNLSFQPGDVVGYYVSSTKGMGINEGIQLKTDSGGESVWYHSGTDGPLIVNSGEECAVTVGSGNGRDLSSFTSAAPVFSIETASSSCAVPPTPAATVSHTVSTSPLPVSQASSTSSLPVSSDHTIRLTTTMTPSLTVQTPPQDGNAGADGIVVSETISTRTHTPSSASTPTTFTSTVTAISNNGLDLKEMGIIAGVCVSAMLVISLGILAAAITLYRWKIARLTEIYSRPYSTKKDDLSHFNPSIKTTINESYAANTVMTVNGSYETLKRLQKISHSSSSRGGSGPGGGSSPYYAVLTPNDQSSETGQAASEPYYAVLTPSDQSSVTGSGEEENAYEYPSC